MVSIAVQTAVVDVMASGEFCNMRRRIAHLLTMYGFVIYVVTNRYHGFRVPNARHAGAQSNGIVVRRGPDGLASAATGSGFSSGSTLSLRAIHRFRLIRADLFIVSLVLSVTFGLAWAYVQTTGNATWQTCS